MLIKAANYAKQNSLCSSEGTTEETEELLSATIAHLIKNMSQGIEMKKSEYEKLDTLISEFLNLMLLVMESKRNRLLNNQIYLKFLLKIYFLSMLKMENSIALFYLIFSTLFNQI